MCFSRSTYASNNEKPSWQIDDNAVNSLFLKNLQTGPLGVLPPPTSLQLKRQADEAYRAKNANQMLNVADSAALEKDYKFASKCYYQASQLFADKRDDNMAYYAFVRGQRYESQIGIFVKEPASKIDWQENYSHAVLEPKIGCYVGAFIDNEPSLQAVLHGANLDLRRNPNEFNEETGVHHSFFFIYLGYGKPFPTEWAKILKSNHEGLQIAFEPKTYAQVKDDGYLEQFANDAAASGIPIFLRFASEMNGDWVSYHGSPTDYIKMFQVVARVMHKHAPNVAMLWCPFATPQHSINEYYPGDKAVDWVGVNIYSVLFHDNDPDRNAQLQNPSDQLAYIYSQYAARKPIAIGEYGASHMQQLEMKPRDEYAIIKMNQFYNSLRLIYPRVKMVNWLSMNAIVHAEPGRQLNDYSLLDAPLVLSAYHKLLQPSYFLKDYQPAAKAGWGFVPAKEGLEVSGNIEFAAWLKTCDNLPTAVWILDNSEIKRIVQPGDYSITINTHSLTNGSHTITLVGLNEDGVQFDEQKVKFFVRNNIGG